jgi:L-lactate dehydrogenase complex protein LldG
MSEGESVIDRVRKALGRAGQPPASAPPIPPPLPEHIVRLVHADIGLPELFAKRAAVQNMLVELVSPDEVPAKLVAFLRERKIRRVALAQSRLFEQLDIYPTLEAAGEFESRRWPQMTLDEMYDFDGGVTDVTYAVAETGTLVIVTDANNGRGLSLVPMTHVAIVEPKNLLPDLVDLFERLGSNYPGRHAVMISGPSKTADIEMNVVTGVHGPNIVKAFVIR